MEKIDFESFERANAIFDGHMATCRGVRCRTSCCELKPGDTIGVRDPFNAILFPGELDFLASRVSSSVMKRVIGQLLLSEGRGAEYAISGCLVPVGGIKGFLGRKECVFGENKPVACKLHPFFVGGFPPVMSLQCPVWYELSSDRGIIEQVKKVRTALGFGFDREWERRLAETRDLKSFLDMGGEVTRL